MTESGHRRKPLNIKFIATVVLAVSFLVSLIFYFYTSIRSVEYDSAVYSTMEEPSLPVLYAFCNDMMINPMKGYLQELDSEDSDILTPIGKDRRLKICIKEYGNSIAGLSYEIHSLDHEDFIEKSKVEDFENQSGTVTAVLPIQNLIEENREYLLKIILDTGEKNIYYYTRIFWGDSSQAFEMLSFALDFTQKTFDGEASRELTVYMESDPDNTSTDLGLVSLNSSFSQLTWGNTGMKISSVPQVYLRSCSGMMGSVSIYYQTSMTSAAGEDYFSVEDEFTLKTGTERMYVMDYQRTACEIFDGSKHRFAGKKIMLGISAKSLLHTAQSSNGRFLVFQSDKELWCYDQEAQKAVNVFSFRSEKDDGIRSGWRDHEIQILSVSDEGNIDFTVYGYMNRGSHEGCSGIVYYSYSGDKGTSAERFFMPLAKSTAEIKAELNELCVKGGNDRFFFKQNGTVFAVDLKSLEVMELVTPLEEGTFLSNPAQTRFAWLENGIYDSKTLVVMNTETCVSQKLTAKEGGCLLLLGFNGNDLIVGEGDPEEKWMLGKRTRSLPFHRIAFYDENLSCIMTYQKDGLYIDDFVKSGNRFQLNLYNRSEDGQYRLKNSDTIVCAEPDDYSDRRRVGTSVSEEKQTVYSITIDQEIKNTKKLEVCVPDSLSYEDSGVIEIKAKENSRQIRFTSWANGCVQGYSISFKKAVTMCYSDMGWITVQDGGIVLNRCDRESYHTVKQPLEKIKTVIEKIPVFSENTYMEDGMMLIDAYGCEMGQLLGFVYKDYPIFWLDDAGGYQLIYGYDVQTVKILKLDEEFQLIESQVVNREEAEKRFGENGGNFICFCTPDA